ncbi:MAG: VOC family protein [Planctomycetota bacterium]
MPPVSGIIETVLYVEDLDRARAWYRDVFGFEEMGSNERGCSLNVAEKHVLLLFKRGASTQPMAVSGGMLPPHDGSGQSHVGFAIDVEQFEAWKLWLVSKGVTIESRINWPRGGKSLYFRDLDDHLLEVLTPGVWTIY